MMSKTFKTVGLPVVLCMALTMAFLNVSTECYGFEIGIDVAPSVLNIQSQGNVVTVHTTISYGSVDHDNVYLNGIEIASWKADNRGYFVAKFLMSEVKALVDNGDLEVPADYEIELVGYTNDGAEFSGSQTITVINVIPEGGKQ